MSNLIKLLIMDVDGTLTDGKIYMSDTGELFKAFDIKDGCGIHDILPKANIIPVVLTARQSKIVENRCREMGIVHCYQGVRNKVRKLQEIAVQFDLSNYKTGVYSEIAYIGDDIIDLPCMRLCGIVGCPMDAADEIKDIAQFISQKCGGNGAVREFIEWLVERRTEE